jgi:hypothetical protein
MLVIGIDAEDHEAKLRLVEGPAGAMPDLASLGSALRDGSGHEPAVGAFDPQPQDPQAS